MDAVTIAASYATRRLAGSKVCDNYMLPLFASRVQANTAVCALAIALTQLATECMTHDHNVTHMVAASWSVALKLIYDESTYLIDVFSVWNEVVGLASELTYVKLVAAERQILLFAAKSSFFYSSISQHIQSFRSALLRTLLEEHNTTPALECVKDALRVVIIDDCPLTRQIHEIFVTTAAPNAAVRLAANYSEALELYSDFRPHVILIDLNLNDAMGYNGYKLCSILHTQENTSMLNHREGHDTKDGDIAPALVVAVTGCSFDETMSCNFDAVWTKPLTLHAAKCILGHAWEV